MSRIVLVIGGAGYVGSAVTHAFRDAGWVAVIGSRSAQSDTHSVHCDVRDMSSVIQGCEHVIAHHGTIDAIVHVASPHLERVKHHAADATTTESHMRTAVAGTEHVINAAQQFNVHTIVVITSRAAFADPSTLTMGTYPEAKRMQEEISAQAAREYHHSRIFTIAPGFLPGGLNADLPTALRQSLAVREDGSTSTPQALARIIVAVVTDVGCYPKSGRIDPVTGTHTPF